MSNKNNGDKSKKVIIIIATIISLVLCVISFSLGSLFGMTNIGTEYKGILKEYEDVEKYKLLFDIRDMLITKYDGEIDDELLLEGAAKGMTAALQDPYTVYMNDDEYKKFMEDNEGEFVGVGIQIGIKDNKVTVISPIENSPAEKAGIKKGDIILKVNDLEVFPENMDNAISIMKGKEGEAVDITVEQEGKEKVVKVVRSKIEIISVKSEMIDDKVGYIQIVSFDEDVAKDFSRELDTLKSKGMKGLVLDLRGNPGGYLNECVDIASQFIEKNKIVTYTIDKYDNKEEAKSIGGNAIGIPLVVLVDGGSASASEVVTGALRDYDAATIVGENTFGKGVVQQLIPINNSGLKVTTSRYYTPNGENIHGIGIKPDIVVEYPSKLLEEEYNRNKDPQFKKALEVINKELE